MGYVHNEAGIDAAWVASGKWEIEVGLKREPAKASLKPMYDPTSARLKVCVSNSSPPQIKINPLPLEGGG
jgi:hypothetical protein